MPVRRIQANIMDLLQEADQLILDADATAGVSTITVQSILGVAINKILLFRDPGSEFAEIVATHAVTAPSGNTVTLASALVESHPAGTVVYIIPANQVRFYHATTEVDANSDDSTLSALAAAQSIDPTSINNHYDDSTQTSGFYFYRFIDSINSINSLYSDPIPWNIRELQFAVDEVGYILEFVKNKVGFEWSDKFSKSMAYAEINACLSFIDGKQLRWPNHFVNNYVLGQTSRGVFEFTLPTNIYDNDTNKSILNMKFGDSTRPLIWKDEKEFDAIMGEAVRSTVRTIASIGGVTLAIANSYDFDDAGTVHLFTSNTDDAVTYTGVTRSATAGVLTGVPASGDGSIAAAHAVGINVWQNHSEGEPLYFTIANGVLRIWPLPNSTWINKNLLMDYWTVATQVNSESDTIEAQRYDMVKHWLLWQARAYTQNNGKASLTDDDYVMFRDILSDSIRRKQSGQKFKMKPKINSITYRGSRAGNFDTE
jgi:hypothetical protein